MSYHFHGWCSTLPNAVDGVRKEKERLTAALSSEKQEIKKQAAEYWLSIW